jgi:hypothetical protein
LNLSSDHFEYAVQVSRSVRIPEAHHRDAAFGQPLVAFAIGCFVVGLSMLAAIKLDRESQWWAIEIENE